MDFPKLEKFEIKSKIRHKACFTLYEALDRESSYPVHLKLLDPKLNGNEGHVANFLGGARIIKHLNHPNICRVLELGQEQRAGYYYVASEPTQLDSLSALILDEFSLSLEDLLDIFSVLGKTLRYAHLHGLVHGFLNPDSIYVKPDGAIKIDDFGFSWFIPSLFEQNDADALYLTKYIAPEFHSQGEIADGRSDIYSTGIILYQLLSGQHPFEGKTIDSIKARHLQGGLPPINLEEMGLPASLEGIVKNAVCSNRELRFQNVKEYLQALASVTSGGSALKRPDRENEVEIAFAPEQSEKYFASGELPESEEGVSGFDFDASESIFKKKYAVTGFGALFLVVLILFVTNYIPSFFGSDSDSNGGLQDYNASTEVLMHSTGSSVTDSISGQNNSDPNSHPSIYDQFASEDNGTDSDDLLAAERNTTKPPPAKIYRSKAGAPKTTANSAKPKSPPVTTAPESTTPATKRKVASKPPDEIATKPKPATKRTQPPKPAPVKTATVNVVVKSNNQPIDANIFFDNRFVGKTSKRGTLAVPKLQLTRTYTVKISKEGYSTTNQRVKITASTPSLSFDIKARNDLFGTVLIDAVPRADEIYIDGQKHTGPTPARVSLKSGRHTIRLVNAKLKTSHEQKIDLKIGQVFRIKHDFTKKETGRVAISLKNAAQYGFGYVWVDGKIWHEKHNTTPLEVKLTAGSHTIEVKRDGFNSVPKDVIVKVEKGQTKYVSFSFMKTQRN